MEILAIDITSHRLALALLDNSHVIIDQYQIPAHSAEEIWPEIESVIDQFTFNLVLLAFTGKFDVSLGTISPKDLPQWREFPIVALLRSLAPAVPIELFGEGALGTTHDGFLHHSDNFPRSFMHESDRIAPEIYLHPCPQIELLS